jgi:hypothetical protein
MPTTFICDGCHLEKPANPCLKAGQRYCADPKCQRERKRLWQKAAMTADDAIYRTKQIAFLKHWRKEHPLHRYQKQYRENHPDYVKNNREKQRVRNRKRCHKAESTSAEKIVKMDALPNRLIKSGIYLMQPCEMDASKVIVKMDALVVELKLFQGDNLPLPHDCKNGCA